MRVSVFVVLALAACVAGCGEAEVVSCTLNPSDTDPYFCTETKSSLCGGDCECSATPPNVVVKSSACDDGWQALCSFAYGAFYYYNETTTGSVTVCVFPNYGSGAFTSLWQYQPEIQSGTYHNVLFLQ